MARRWLVYAGCGLVVVALVAMAGQRADPVLAWTVAVAAMVLAAIAFAIDSALAFRERWRTAGDDFRATTYRDVAVRAVFVCIAALACAVAAIVLPFHPALPFAIPVAVASLAIAITATVIARRYSVVESVRRAPDVVVSASPPAAEPAAEPQDTGRSAEDDEEERFRTGQQGY